MAYCTTSHVAAEFKDITFSATSSITTTEVERFITEADAEIDGILGARFQVPVVGSTSLIVIRTISILIVAARIQRILKVKTGDDKLEQDVQSARLRNQAMFMLKQIIDGKLILPDATLINSSDGVRSYATDAGQEHNFKLNEAQW